MAVGENEVFMSTHQHHEVHEDGMPRCGYSERIEKYLSYLGIGGKQVMPADCTPGDKVCCAWGDHAWLGHVGMESKKRVGPCRLDIQAK